MEVEQARRKVVRGKAIEVIWGRLGRSLGPL